MKNTLLFLYHIIICVIIFTPFSVKSQSISKKLYLQIDSKNQPKKIIALKNYNQLKKHVDSLTANIQLQGYLSSRYEKPLKINDSTYSTALNKRPQTKQVVINNWSQIPKVIKKNTGLKNNN